MGHALLLLSVTLRLLSQTLEAGTYQTGVHQGGLIGSWGWEAWSAQLSMGRPKAAESREISAWIYLRDTDSPAAS